MSTVDARRGEIFYATYRKTAGGIQRISDPHVDQPENVANQLSAQGEDCLVVGDGAQRYAEIFTDMKGVEVGQEGFRFPNAGSLVELAHPKALREELLLPHPKSAPYTCEPRMRVSTGSNENAHDDSLLTSLSKA